ncbi:MAG: DUF489 family protein, partial [Gammaproteobacteria bacterium]|nr:DUF489 family protein [Gammaproteobacteria bacterium]
FDPTHDNVLANLADTYVNTIGTLRPRVLVNGEHGHLQNPRNVNLIRALLLAGIRSATLWYQCGGSRWNLLFSRRSFLAAADELLQAKSFP